MKYRRRPLSFQGLLVLMKLSVAFVLLLICSAAFVYSNLKITESNLHERIHSAAGLLGKNLAVGLHFMDKKQSASVLSSVETDPLLKGGWVFDKDGLDVASYGETASLMNLTKGLSEASIKKLEEPTWIGPNEDRLLYVLPIVEDRERIGTLVLLASTASLAEQYALGLKIVGGVLLFGIIFTFFLASFLQRILSVPIAKILSVAKRIREEENYSLRVADAVTNPGAKEIYDLTIEFDQMLTLIEKHNKEIQTANELLEERVAERTVELRETQQSLVQSSKFSALGEMAGGIAHEINNPLAIIVGKASTLKTKFEKGIIPGDESISRDFNSIIKTSLRIGTIIKGLKSFSRDGSADPFEVTDLQVIVDDTLELCQSRMKNTFIDLRMGMIPKNTLISCRAVQISQVLLNLLNNSADAIASLETKWIEVEFQTKDSHIFISVTDSGPGIPKEIRDRLMQPFFTTKALGKGTGLGLSISKGIVETHKGKFSLDTSCKNTKFIIELPLMIDAGTATQ